MDIYTLVRKDILEHNWKNILLMTQRSMRQLGALEGNNGVVLAFR